MDEATRTIMEGLIDARVAPLKESQRATTAVLAHFESVLAGDPKYEREGMAAQVKRHEDVIDGWKEEMSQIRGIVKAGVGTVKTIMLVGGAIFTIIDIALRVYGK